MFSVAQKTFEKNKIKMKKTVFTILFILALFVSSYAQPKLGKPYQIESFSVDGSTRLEVKTSGGHIYVERSNDSEVRVEMYVRKKNRSYGQGEADLDDYTIAIQKRGNTVQALAQRNGGFSYMDWNDNYSIHFIVYTPRKTQADLKTSGGHVTIKGLEGEIVGKTSGGHITGEDLTGLANLHTSGGHINVSEFEGILDASTSGGHITLEQVSGELTFKTSGGHLKLERVAGNINGKTSGGHINGDITSIFSECNLKTSGGNISLSLPANEGFSIEAKGGRVSANFANFNGSKEKDEISGTVNGGGSKVYLKTSGGKVSVRAR